MNIVGIDVSKGKSMVAIMQPFGEIVSTPFKIKHITSDINSLIELIHQLSEANPFVISVNFILFVYSRLINSYPCCSYTFSQFNPICIPDNIP